MSSNVTLRSTAGAAASTASSDPPRRRMSTTVFDQAFDVAARAMEAEAAKKPEQALQLYQLALEHFIAVMKEYRSVMDPRCEELVRERMAEFLTRAELMQMLITSSKRIAGAGAGAGVGGGASAFSSLPGHKATPTAAAVASTSSHNHIDPVRFSSVPSLPTQPKPSPNYATSSSATPSAKAIPASYHTSPPHPPPHPSSKPPANAGWRMSAILGSAWSAASNTVQSTASVVGQVASDYLTPAISTIARTVSPDDGDNDNNAIIRMEEVVGGGPPVIIRSMGPLPRAPSPFENGSEEEKEGGGGEFVSPLPEGFVEYMDDERGIPYYYNTVTQESVWERPKRTEKTATSEEKKRNSARKSASRNIVGGSEVQDIDQAKKDLSLLKDRLSRLILGDDQSGGSASKASALTISNAITNLAAATQGELKKLEPMSEASEEKWKKELDWILLPLEHIVVRESGWKTDPSGEKVEIMVSRKREDIELILPELKSLDQLLIDVLECFRDQTFLTYVKRDPSEAIDGKWWIEKPVLPRGGLSAAQLKKLEQCVSCATYVLNNARDINASVMRSMPIPQNYVGALPWNATPAVGAELPKMFGSLAGGAIVTCDDIVSTFNITSDEQAYEMLEKLDKMRMIWRRKVESNPKNVLEAGKFAQVNSIIPELKKRFPGARQTSVEIATLSENLDIGKSALEAYSRVLESRAASILSRLQEVADVHKRMREEIV